MVPILNLRKEYWYRHYEYARRKPYVKNDIDNLWYLGDSILLLLQHNCRNKQYNAIRRFTFYVDKFIF